MVMVMVMVMAMMSLQQWWCRGDDVVVALRFYRKRTDVDADMEEMDTEDQQKSTGEDTTFTMKMLVTSPDLRRPLFIASMLQVIQQFSGINAVSIPADDAEDSEADDNDNDGDDNAVLSAWIHRQ